MYDDHPSLVLSRAYIALKQSREELKGKNKTISGVEFHACGGKRKKDKDDYSLERQVTIALRSIRDIIREEKSFFDPDSKAPAKKQMTQVLADARTVLNDLNNDTHNWYHSDNEEIDDMDGDVDDEEDDEDGEEEEQEEEDDVDDTDDPQDADADDPQDPDADDPQDPDADDPQDPDAESDTSDAGDDSDDDEEEDEDGEEDE